MDINNRKRNEISPVVMVLILLFFLFPPLAIIGAVFLAAYKQGKKTPSPESRTIRTEIENLKRSGKTAKEQFLRRMKEEDAAEQPYKSHPHTPVSYSYDTCAREKRLEQLKVLYEAGLLDAVEYQQRKQEILSMR
ncbi:MAG: SHOCT domain-containing protein [Ruminococcaceae bacterium]|nr:SHOCT domain-containing protein [Oscillospiraceae bacterium]